MIRTLGTASAVVSLSMAPPPIAFAGDPHQFRPQHTAYAAGSAPRSVAMATSTVTAYPTSSPPTTAPNTVSVFSVTETDLRRVRTDFATGAYPKHRGPRRRQQGQQTRPHHRGLRRQRRKCVARQRQWHLRGDDRLRDGRQPIFRGPGDIDKDGNLDIVTANYGDSTVSVFPATATAPSPARSDIRPAAPLSAVIGDVNRDGNPDIVTADTNTNTASVLIGSGSGDFGSPIAYSTGAGPTKRVSLGDLNSDGTPDIVTANVDGAAASVLLGNGDGTFTEHVGSRHRCAGRCGVPWRRQQRRQALTWLLPTTASARRVCCSATAMAHYR